MRLFSVLQLGAGITLFCVLFAGCPLLAADNVADRSFKVSVTDSSVYISYRPGKGEVRIYYPEYAEADPLAKIFNAYHSRHCVLLDASEDLPAAIAEIRPAVFALGGGQALIALRGGAVFVIDIPISPETMPEINRLGAVSEHSEHGDRVLFFDLDDPGRVFGSIFVDSSGSIWRSKPLRPLYGPPEANSRQLPVSPLSGPMARETRARVSTPLGWHEGAGVLPPSRYVGRQNPWKIMERFIGPENLAHALRGAPGASAALARVRLRLNEFPSHRWKVRFDEELAASEDESLYVVAFADGYVGLYSQAQDGSGRLESAGDVYLPERSEGDRGSARSMRDAQGIPAVTMEYFLEKIDGALLPNVRIRVQGVRTTFDLREILARERRTREIPLFFMSNPRSCGGFFRGRAA